MKVSIITPSYNQGQFIERTILSVLNQTYKNIEYIVIDGGSTDNTMEVLERYKDRINIVVHEKDKGQSDAINKGFKLASGFLVGWINSDDILYSNCVEKIVYLATLHPEGSIYYPAIIDLINSADKKTGQIKKIIKNKSTLIQNDYSLIQQGSFYNLQTVKKVNYLNDRKQYCMDLDLWLKLLDNGRIYYYDRAALAAFRLWEDSKTTTGGVRFLKDIKETLQLHNMKLLSQNNLRLNWYMLKGVIKRFLLQKIKVTDFVNE
jgi:glycosyltransferase involved in cell wall biosynthesis